MQKFMLGLMAIVLVTCSPASVAPPLPTDRPTEIHEATRVETTTPIPATVTTTDTRISTPTVALTATQTVTPTMTATAGRAPTLARTPTRIPTASATLVQILPTVFMPPPASAVPPAPVCCKVCRAGKACGDSCIAKDKTCNSGPGCACNG